jgi:SMC interacting uncharacterized protein involved in chromosome segregation
VKKREAVKLEVQMRDARATERQAEVTLAKTREALARAERERERLQKELDAIALKTQALTDQIRRQEAAVRQASLERMRLEERRG